MTINSLARFHYEKAQAAAERDDAVDEEMETVAYLAALREAEQAQPDVLATRRLPDDAT